MRESDASRPGRAAAVAVTLIVAALGRLVAFGNQGPLQRHAAPMSLAAGPDLPSGAIRFIAVDGEQSVWFRVANPAGGADQVAVIRADGRRQDYANLRAVVDDRGADIRRIGSLTDFWSVDSGGRVWVGAAYHDGGGWTEVARDRSYPGGGISYEERVAVDAADNAWVPYRTVDACPAGGMCSGAGLAALTAAGALVGEIALQEVSELVARDLPQVRFAPLTGGRLLAVASRTAYALPDATAIVLPGFEVDPRTGGRDAGFASAVTSHGGDAAVFAWRDPAAPGAATVIEELRGSGASWERIDLRSSPLFRRGADGRFVTAAAYGPGDVLWLASSDGELAVRRANEWPEFFTAQNKPLGAPIRALAVDDKGTLWVGTSRGALMYRDRVWYPNDIGAFQLSLPSLP